MKMGKFRGALVLVAAVVAMLAVASPAWAAEFVVNSSGDTSDSDASRNPNNPTIPSDGVCDTGEPVEGGRECTLRAALEQANRLAFEIPRESEHRITFDLPSNPNTGVPTIYLRQSGKSLRVGGYENYIVDTNVEIEGPGDLIVSAAGNESRVFDVVFSRTTATIEGVTIQDGLVRGLSEQQPETSGGIDNGGDLTLSNVVVRSNTAVNGQGGGIYNSGNLTVVDSTISGNSGALGGGGIKNVRGGTLTLKDSTVQDNRSGKGGGIDNTGDSLGSATAIIENSTISGNSVGGNPPSDTSLAVGGGIRNTSNLTVRNSTITNNRAIKDRGTGIAALTLGSDAAASTSISSSIISGNFGLDLATFQSPPGSDVSDLGGGGFSSAGYNLIGTGNVASAFNATGDQTDVTDPKLGPLADNGGPTPTHLPASDSPAVDNGSNPENLLTDQRGAARSLGLATDVGSVEVETGDPPELSLEERIVRVTEGDSGTNDATFVLELSRPTAKTVTVGYATRDGDPDDGAKAGEDYVSTSGALTFDAGETRKTISVPVVGDTRDEESPEDFFLDLSTNENASLLDPEGIGVISDNDSPPEVSISDLEVIEGDSGVTNATFTVSLSKASGRQNEVEWYSEDETANGGSPPEPGDDFAANTGSRLGFDPGETEKEVTVQVYGDTATEPDETFLIRLEPGTLGNARIADDTAVGTILNDDYTPQANDDGSASNPVTLDEDGPGGLTTDVLSNDAGLGDEPITVEVTTPARKGTATVNADNTVTYTSDPNENGDDSYGYTVTDSDGQTSAATVHLLVAAVNDPPENSVPGPQATDEDTPLTFSAANGNPISVSDPDAVGGAVEVTLSANGGVLTLGGTAGLAFSSGDGAGDASMTFSGTVGDVNAALEGSRFDPRKDRDGTATITVVTDDLGNTGSGGAKTDTGTVEVALRPINDAPEASGIPDRTVDEDAATGPIPFTVSDAEAAPGDLTLTASSDNRTLVPDGNIVFGGSGGNRTVNVTPAKDRSGTARITVFVDDGAATATRTFKLTVRATNDAPAAGDDVYSMDANRVLRVPAGRGVLANDSDADGDRLGARVVARPENGRLTLGADGSFVYRPGRGYSGPDSFSYGAGDGRGGTDTATVRLIVRDTIAPAAIRMRLYTIRKGDPGRVRVKAYFSEAMRAGTVNARTFRLVPKGGGKPVDAAVRYAANERAALLTPRRPLAPGSYTAKVTTGARDLAGNRIEGDAAWTVTITRAGAKVSRR